MPARSVFRLMGPQLVREWSGVAGTPLSAARCRSSRTSLCPLDANGSQISERREFPRITKTRKCAPLALAEITCASNLADPNREWSRSE